MLWDWRFMKYIPYAPFNFKLWFLKLLLLLLGWWQDCWYAGSLNSLSQEMEDPPEIIPITNYTVCILCLCIFQIGTLGSFPPLFFLYSCYLRRWLSTNADRVSAIYGKPQTRRCSRQILLLLQCCSVYKHISQITETSCPLLSLLSTEKSRDHSFR